MKKFFLLFSFGVTAFAAQAQLTLTGSSYSQNFDGIGSGLPTEWSVYSGASSTYIGNLTTLGTFQYPPAELRPDTSCAGSVFVGGFKNFPSADTCSPGDDWCASPAPSYSNRALGVRQVSPTNATHPNLDSGAAFVLSLANTAHQRNLQLSFELQSLDTSSARTTHWLVDYAIGATPTAFIPATTTTGVWTTGNHTFSNNTVTVDFGTALDMSTQPVYIRIVTLVYSSGSGNRASTAIDNFNLTWMPPVGVEDVAENTQNLGLTVLGEASSDNILFGFNSKEVSKFEFNLTDMTGHSVYHQSVSASVGTQSLSVSGLHLAPGMYIATMNDAATKAVVKVIVI